MEATSHSSDTTQPDQGGIMTSNDPSKLDNSCGAEANGTEGEQKETASQRIKKQGLKGVKGSFKRSDAREDYD